MILVPKLKEFTDLKGSLNAEEMLNAGMLLLLCNGFNGPAFKMEGGRAFVRSVLIHGALAKGVQGNFDTNMMLCRDGEL